MTTAAIPAEVDGPPVWVAVTSAGAGLLLLLARPLIATTVGWTDVTVVALFTAILALAIAPPLGGVATADRPSLRVVVLVAAAGALVFLGGRMVSGGYSPDALTIRIVGLNTLASVAEEALFRRVVFAALLPAGPLAAITGSALLFGLAHATVYGWWAVPLDSAAGLVLGWQRWASGSWTAPALTHALADFLVVI